MNSRFSTLGVEWSNSRGVSEVLGSILVFGLVLAVLGLVQVSGVPAANEEVEFDHNQRVQNDFLEFQQVADVTATQGSAQSVNVEAGTRYPNRFLLRNPPEAAGSIGTETSGFSIENARAVDSETAQFWTGSLREYDSSAVVFRPNYNVYDSAPTTSYEHGIAYNSHPNGETTLVGAGEVIDGNRITLIAVDGSLSTASASTLALEAQPLSAPMQSVSVRDDEAVTGDRITLRLQTGMTETAWAELLDDEANVFDWSLAGDQLTIELAEDVVYDMRLAKIGVGSGYTDEEATYLANGAVAPRFVELGGNTISVEVRDQFNTVKPGVDVTYTLDDGQGYFIDDQGIDVGGTHVVTSDEKGLAKIVFKPTGGNTATVSATADLGYPGTTPDDNEIVVFEDIAVISGGGGGGGGDGSEINPAASDSFELKSAILTTEKVGNKNNIGVAYMTFENKGDQASIEAVRINSYVDNSQSASNKKHPDYAIINGTQVFVGGDYVSSFATGFKVDYQPNDEKSYRVEFWDEDDKPFDVDEGDFFILSIEFEDGSISRYFVVPDDQS